MSSTWATTFYYGQELRSAYMNNLLKGALNPGIYNLNAAVYTKNSDNQGEQGIWLRINAGAQFVFSNGYDVVNNKLERTLDRLGDYVVKCVAETTVDVPLAIIGGTNTAIFEATNAVDHITKAPVVFVYAALQYLEDQETLLTEPAFRLAVPSSNEILGTDASLQLPNEGFSPSDASADTRMSYLLVGVLLDNGEFEAPYGAEADWARDGRNADEDWVKGHVFVGQGLQEHGNGMEKVFSKRALSFLFTKQYNRLFLTEGQFYFNTILYDIDGIDWKGAYGQNDSPISAAPTALTGMIADHAIANASSNTYLSSPLTLTGQAGKMIIEILFLAVESEYSRSELPDLSGLLTGGFAVSRKLLPFRVVCNAPSGLELDTTGLWEDYAFTAPRMVVPLDVSIVNIERLKDILANNNVLLPIVDTMRQNGLSASPFLDPTTGGALVPLLMSFRKVNSTEDGFTDPATLLTGAGFNDVTGTPGASTCNPANVLSFFDLQDSSFEVTNAGIVAREVYPTIPFID